MGTLSKQIEKPKKVGTSIIAPCGIHQRKWYCHDKETTFVYPDYAETLRGAKASVQVGTTPEERSQTVLIVEQSVAIQVNGLSASQPWLMCDLEGQPVAQQLHRSHPPSPHAANASLSFSTTPSGLSTAYDSKYLIK